MNTEDIISARSREAPFCLGIGSQPTFQAWVPGELDLSDYSNCVVVGEVNLATLAQGVQIGDVYRPLLPFDPAENRQLHQEVPEGLKQLYKVACRDMCNQGLNPDEFYCYAFVLSGIVEPESVLQEGHWHFDFKRNLRDVDDQGRLPVTISYGVSNVLPTVFAKQLVTEYGSPLPAYETISNTELHHELGVAATRAGRRVVPKPGEVVRYDTLTLHHAQHNDTGEPLPRIFMHIAFSPIPPGSPIPPPTMN